MKFVFLFVCLLDMSSLIWLKAITRLHQQISGQLSWLTRIHEYAIECYLPQHMNKCIIESLIMQYKHVGFKHLIFLFRPVSISSIHCKGILLQRLFKDC